MDVKESRMDEKRGWIGKEDGWKCLIQLRG